MKNVFAEFMKFKGKRNKIRLVYGIDNFIMDLTYRKILKPTFRMTDLGTLN